MDVIETLDGHVALIFDERIVRPAEVCESGTAGGCDAAGPGVRDTRRREAEEAAAAGPRVAADDHRAVLFAGIQGSRVTARSRNVCRLLRTSVTCHPKCQKAVAGCVAGGVSTLVNSTQTLLGERRAGCAANTARDVLGNCAV